MKFRHTLFFLAAILLLFSFRADETEPVKWNAQRPLTWNDFSGDFDSESPYDGWTWAGIKYTYSWTREGSKVKMDLDAHAFFDPQQSWVKEDKKSDRLLKHEQLHFDIAELYCRYFETAVRNFKFTQNVDTEVDSLYNSYLQQLLAAQIKYDEESQHYHDLKGQAKWEQLLKDELTRLHD